METAPGSTHRAKQILASLSALAFWMPHAFAFNEDWEQASPGTYQPSEQTTLIRADAGTWILADTVSSDPTECGPVRNSAEIIPWNNGQALRLNSVDSGSGCSDNLFLFIQAGPQLGLNPGFGIPLRPDTTLSFEESGSLTAPDYFPRHSNCITPPCYDAVTLYVQDNLSNTLAYVLQRAAQAVPQDRSGYYREIFLDPAGRYSRNLYEDFSTLADFRPQDARIAHIEMEIREHGSAVFDQLSISGGSPPAVSKASRRCAASQLLAAGNLCKADFTCRSAYVAKAAADPTGARLTRCRGGARNRFQTAYDQALAKAVATGATCALTEPGAAVSAELLSGLQSVAAGMEAGWIPVNRVDSRLRATLLSAAGTMCGKGFRAEGLDANAPNPRKLAAARAGAERKFLAAANKALRKAKGIRYFGDSPVVTARQVQSAISAYTAKARPDR